MSTAPQDNVDQAVDNGSVNATGPAAEQADKKAPAKKAPAKKVAAPGDDVAGHRAAEVKAMSAEDAPNAVASANAAANAMIDQLRADSGWPAHSDTVGFVKKTPSATADASADDESKSTSKEGD